MSGTSGTPAIERLRSPRLRFGAVLAVAAALAAVLIGASQLGAHDESASPAPPPAAEPTAPAESSLFAGIPQQGAALGAPHAPVTLVEYADLQCPYCAVWANEALPTLVERYVRAGKVRIVFHGLAFLGPDSDKALRTAVAAGQKNHLWDVVHGLYANQGPENSGWVTDDLVTRIAAGIPGLDGPELLDARWAPSVEPQLKAAAAAAKAAGINGTPTFQIGRTGGPLEVVELTSLGPEGIVPSIEARLAA